MSSQLDRFKRRERVEVEPLERQELEQQSEVHRENPQEPSEIEKYSESSSGVNQKSIEVISTLRDEKITSSSSQSNVHDDSSRERLIGVSWQRSDDLQMISGQQKLIPVQPGDQSVESSGSGLEQANEFEHCGSKESRVRSDRWTASGQSEAPIVESTASVLKASRTADLHQVLQFPRPCIKFSSNPVRAIVDRLVDGVMVPNDGTSSGLRPVFSSYIID